MSGAGLRWLGAALLATAGAGFLALTSILHSAFAFGDDTALVPFALGFGALPLLEAGAIDISEFTSLIP